MWFVGIDWAEKHLDFCIENLSGDVILRGRVDNTDDGFNSLLSAVAKENSDLASTAVSIESPHQRVVDFLLARGVSVYPVNPSVRCVTDAFHRPFMTTARVASLKEASQTIRRFVVGELTADAQLLSDYL